MPEITPDDIFLAIKSLTSKKARYSNEDLPLHALKHICQYIKYPLWCISNLVVKTGECPGKLKGRRLAGWKLDIFKNI